MVDKKTKRGDVSITPYFFAFDFCLIGCINKGLKDLFKRSNNY